MNINYFVWNLLISFHILISLQIFLFNFFEIHRKHGNFEITYFGMSYIRFEYSQTDVYLSICQNVYYINFGVITKTTTTKQCMELCEGSYFVRITGR